MGVRITRTGAMASSAWDAQAMEAAALLARSVVVLRTQENGRGEDDQPLAKYSTDPLKLYYRSNTAKRLKPKGGTPFPWVRGPRLRGGGYDRSKIGDEGGQFFAGGYAGYKAASRKGVDANGAVVDLTLSGQMMREFRVLRVSRMSAFIGWSGQARTYAPHTDARRPWIALSPSNIRELEAELPGIVEGAARRSTNGAR